MWQYLARRLLLLPVTLFFIILINFIIINLAPGDPTSVTEINPQGATRRSDRAVAFGTDDRFLQFREFYGLTLPILINTWPWLTLEDVHKTIQALAYDKDKMSVKDYDAMRVQFGDQSRFIMPKLLHFINDPQATQEEKNLAKRFFVRGGTRQAILGSGLTEEQKAYNLKVAKDNQFLSEQPSLEALTRWYEENKTYYHFEPTTPQKIYSLFFETRFAGYFGRVLTLDFGTLRNDNNKSVISEVVKRFKYSLTLSVIPMLVTLVLCTLFGFVMAYHQGGWWDYSLNLVFLVLYAIPIFVAAPFLIEKVAIGHHFPFTQTPIPISGFTSPDSVYDSMTSWQRLGDVMRHIALPLVAVLYGSLAAQARLSRTAILEVMRQDYVRTARAKGLSTTTIMGKHVGRNAAITIVTSIASSLGIILGGSLIVETLFDINGFGKFFYDAVINRDYNVIMFSAIAGSFLTLLGYLVADITYTILDPRVSLE